MSAKVVKENASNIPGLMSSHSARKDDSQQSTNKESMRAPARSRQSNQDGGASSTKKAS